MGGCSVVEVVAFGKIAAPGPLRRSTSCSIVSFLSSYVMWLERDWNGSVSCSGLGIDRVYRVDGSHYLLQYQISIFQSPDGGERTVLSFRIRLRRFGMVAEYRSRWVKRIEEGRRSIKSMEEGINC